jgi:hypothetical protein
MLTMHPVVLRGRTGLALPGEEFAERVARTQNALSDHGLDAILAFGDSRNYAPLTWVSGLVPMLKWAVALVPNSGEVELFVAMPGARDLPAIRRLAVVGSVSAISELPQRLATLQRVAVAGLGATRARTEAAIRSATEIVEGGDQLLGEMMSLPSPAERGLLRQAASTARQAVTTIAVSYAGGTTVSDALLAGDRAARVAGMHDTRLLFSLDSGRTLRPLTGRVAAHPDALAFYLAVELGGYWGEALGSVGSCVHLALAPIARLGLSVEEGVEEPLGPGIYSLRELDEAGALRSRTIEVP